MLVEWLKLSIHTIAFRRLDPLDLLTRAIEPPTKPLPFIPAEEITLYPGVNEIPDDAWKYLCWDSAVLALQEEHKFKRYDFDGEYEIVKQPAYLRVIGRFEDLDEKHAIEMADYVVRDDLLDRLAEEFGPKVQQAVAEQRHKMSGYVTHGAPAAQVY